MIKINKDKRGVMGLSTAQAFIVGLLALVIMGVLSIIVLNALRDSTVLTVTTTVLNESGGFINNTGYTLDDTGVLGFTSPSITSIVNTTDGILIEAGNYTLSSTGVLTNLTAQTWVSVSVNYAYNTQGDGGLITNSTTAGLVTFFTNVSTWLTLLSVVIIILIIGAVIVVVNKFSGGTTSGSL